MSYAITGIQTGLGPGGALPLRQEIDRWSADPNNVDQVNLYLQALASFQQLPATEKLSYFQLAGIHGEPFQPWDEQTNPNPRTRWQGYCTHASILFPTWHRPYLAVFEQILYQIMQHIVAAFPDEQVRARYQAAADTFRIPYWDSAEIKERGGRRSLNVPYLCTLPTVEVFTPTGTTSIDNPLYSFKFPSDFAGITSFQDQEGNFYPFSTSMGTSRYPPPFDQRDPTSTQQWNNGFVDNDQITEALRNLSSLGEDVYRSFTTSNYTWYSSTQQSNPPAPNSYQSLEAIHNEIHGITGGGGHMSWNTVSSFDPIFWLHHCNVDRLFAIWQAIYPNSWFESVSSQLRDDRGTWSTAAGTRDTPETPLAPFHKDTRGSTFNSNDIRNWTMFGSSYPELQPWLPQYQTGGQFNATLYRNDIIQNVTNLYSRVRSRMQRTTVPRNRLFASAQSGPQLLTGPARVDAQTAIATKAPQFAPPPTLDQQFSPPHTEGQQFTAQASTQGQQFTSPPTAQGQQFSPPPIHGQQSPLPPPSQQFSPPPTVQGLQFAPPPTTSQDQQHTAPHTPQGQQFTAPPTDQSHFAPAQKPSGLRGLMSSARGHLEEAITAGREAAHGTQAGPAQPASKPPAVGSHALASKLGSVVGGGIHMAQGRLAGSKKNPAGGPQGSQGRGIDDEPGTEGDTLSRGFGEMSVSDNTPLTYHEYDCNIRFERFGLGGRPFTVHIFLGDFNPNPATWMWDKNRVGGVYNFVAGVPRGDGSNCSNCEHQSQERTIVTGQVSLTTALMDDVEDPSNHLQSLIPEEVVPYLERNLHWRITDPNGRDIPREQLPSLKISVTECSARIPTNPGEFIEYGEPRILHFITQGRPGGMDSSEGC